MNSDSPGKLYRVFRFPNPVNEVAARVVAGGVVLLAVATLVSGEYALLIVLAYGFWARVLTGPTLSPLGQLATRVIAPRIAAPRPVPGPPKRFAQAMGVLFSSAALLAWYGFGSAVAADVLLALLACAAFLESALGICLGCAVFGMLMRRGVIPADVCADCADVSLRSSPVAGAHHV
jgi:hypothetical protein